MLFHFLEFFEVHFVNPVLKIDFLGMAETDGIVRNQYLPQQSDTSKNLLRGPIGFVARRPPGHPRLSA